MNSYEKAEIQRLDSKYRPLGAWEYFGYTLLFSLPLIGFYMFAYILFQRFEHKQTQFRKKLLLRFL